MPSLFDASGAALAAVARRTEALGRHELARVLTTSTEVEGHPNSEQRPPKQAPWATERPARL
jgi:hypothetical protein